LVLTVAYIVLAGWTLIVAKLMLFVLDNIDDWLGR
jgi:hypothetical protein